MKGKQREKAERLSFSTSSMKFYPGLIYVSVFCFTLWSMLCRCFCLGTGLAITSMSDAGHGGQAAGEGRAAALRALLLPLPQRGERGGCV